MSKALLARFSFLAACALAWTGCTVESTERPELSGPSEFALSFNLTATPDAISQDGGSQSQITVRAFDANGQPKSGVAFRLDVFADGQPVDYGTLSFKNLTTGSDGRATATYTSPAPPPPGSNTPACSGLPGNCVEIVATPTGSNHATSHTESVTLRLMPTGVILPPATTPTPQFTFSPSTPSANTPVQFDASSSCAGPGSASGCQSGSGSIVAYDWAFSDGASASGRLVSHTFALGQTFTVTLTVTNDRGVKASTTKSVGVGAGAGPSASFVFSPTSPLPGVPVYFDAKASVPGLGHYITGYTWNWGDGTPTGEGQTATHTFATANIWVVTLTVNDETGQNKTISQPVSVGVTASTTP